MNNNRRQVDLFHQEFKDVYLKKLNNTHLNIIMQRQTQFVGTKTLALSFKFIGISLKFKETRILIKPAIEPILFNISLPLFVASQKDLRTFNEDPVEYVRMQVDHMTEYNVKRQLSVLVEKICSLKFGKKKDNLQSMHLENYVQTIM